MADSFRGRKLLYGDPYSFRVPHALLEMIPNKLDEYVDGDEIARWESPGGNVVVAVYCRIIDQLTGEIRHAVDFVLLNDFLDESHPDNPRNVHR